VTPSERVLSSWREQAREESKYEFFRPRIIQSAINEIERDMEDAIRHMTLSRVWAFEDTVVYELGGS